MKRPETTDAVEIDKRMLIDKDMEIYVRGSYRIDEPTNEEESAFDAGWRAGWEAKKNSEEDETW